VALGTVTAVPGTATAAIGFITAALGITAEVCVVVLGMAVKVFAAVLGVGMRVPSPSLAELVPLMATSEMHNDRVSGEVLSPSLITTV